MDKSKYLGKYRNGTLRAQWWDYSSDSAYFVTIIAQNRVHYFGNIVDGKVNLSVAGQIALKTWLEMPEHFEFAKLGAFVAMPDHVHGIIIIDREMNAQKENPYNSHSASSGDSFNKKSNPEIVEGSGGATGIHNPMLHESLGRLVRWYKGRTTYECRRAGMPIQWQRLYYDIIIRDERAFNAIENYIIQNPAKRQKNRNL